MEEVSKQAKQIAVFNAVSKANSFLPISNGIVTFWWCGAIVGPRRKEQIPIKKLQVYFTRLRCGAGV
jgi:hypothetical protein